MIKLNVIVTLPNNKTLPCGEIVTTAPDPRGIIRGAFRYAAEYLENPLAFPLDPVSLPLISKEFATSRTTGVHAVFEDALPDDWGRKLLIQKAKLGRREQTVPKLLEALGSNGLGALSFASKQNMPDENSSADMVDLEALLNAAFQFDSGLQVTKEDLQLLFRTGSSPGGARPKALVRKKTGSFWIVKFPASNDKLDVVPIEGATLELARLSGLTVPEFEIRNISSQKVLMVKRFDISGHGGRYHMISLQTLLQAEGYYFLDYNDLFNIVRSHSFQPSTDIPALFRQMVFNAAIGNTDDHLQNFCMLHKDPGFCLSPVYDVLPDIYEKREHALSFNLSYLPPDRNILQNIGKQQNIKKPDLIIDEVSQVVSGWRCVFQRYGVPEPDLKKLEWSINRREERLKKI
ncbi:MAG: phosphatidylinositol kinase [Desulfobacteraceae bacterium 4572_123]|nr:MAG: phosphatidylinositol kinase [Desulfobacteraceae bacterium 4572_123]